MSDRNPRDDTSALDRDEAEAFAQLLRRCERRLFLWATYLLRNLHARGVVLSSRLGAEDLVQEAFCAAYQRANHILSLHPNQAMAWLRSAVENCLLQEKRRHLLVEQRSILREVDLAAFETPSGCDFQIENARQRTPSGVLESTEKLREFAAIVAALPGSAREAFVLVKVGGMTMDQAAGELDMTPNAVCLAVGRAAAAIVKAVEKQPDLFPYLSDVLGPELADRGER